VAYKNEPSGTKRNGLVAEGYAEFSIRDVEESVCVPVDVDLDRPGTGAVLAGVSARIHSTSSEG